MVIDAMKCPSCENGKRGVPAHVAWAPGKKPQTESELTRALDAIMKCDICNGTGEITDEQATWINEGKAMKAKRLGLGFGLREAAERFGVTPSLYSDMERGKCKPDPTVLDRVPLKKLEGDASFLQSLLDEARKQERESLAKDIETGRFCRTADHSQGVCDCAEIAAFIRNPVTK